MSYLTDSQRDIVHRWWSALQPETSATGKSEAREKNPFPHFDRGHRARLRRATTLGELEAESSVYLLRERLGKLEPAWVERRDHLWLFLMAGAVAAVAEDSGQTKQAGPSLAMRLGAVAAPSGGSAPFSELRFRRLLSTKDPEEFYLQLRRALRLVNGPIDTASLAEDLIAWSCDQAFGRHSAHSMHYRWARDYYLPRKDLDRAQLSDADTMPQEPRQEIA